MGLTDSTHHSLALRMVSKFGYGFNELSILRRYVSPVVQRAIAARTLDAVSCFTDVTVMFVGISGVDLGLHNPDADMIWGQLIMFATQVLLSSYLQTLEHVKVFSIYFQDCCFDHEGAVNKFVMDDKGALLLCAWGLPPMAHIDDPHRATAAALDLLDAFTDFGVPAHVGVTTGKVKLHFQIPLSPD